MNGYPYDKDDKDDKEGRSLDSRGTSIGESTITVKWWAVFMVFVSIFAFLFIGWTSNNSRITRLEEKYEYVIQSLGKIVSSQEKIEVLVMEIRLDQQRRQAKELK